MIQSLGTEVRSLFHHLCSRAAEQQYPVDALAPSVVSDELTRFTGTGWRMFKFPGIRAQIVSDSGGTWAHSKAFFVIPGLSFAHSHPEDQRTTVVSGALKIQVGKYPAQVLRAGQSVYIPPNVWHKITTVTPQFEAIDEWHPRRSDMKPT